MSNPTTGHRARATRSLRLATVVAALGLAIVAPSPATATDTVVATIPNASGNGSPVGVVVSPDGSRVYSLGPGAGTVSVIDTASKAIVGTIAGANSPYGLVVTPDGTRLYVSDFGADAVRVVDTATNQIVESITVGDGPTGIAISPDGTRVYAANTNGTFGNTTMSIIDTTTVPPAVTVTLAGTLGARSVVVSADGTRVYIANTSSGTSSVSILDTTTNTFEPNISLGTATNQLRSMVLSGTKIYGTRSGSDAVAIIDLTTKLVTTIPGGESATGIALTPDGTRIYVTNPNAAASIDTVTAISTARIGTLDPPVIDDSILVGNDPRGIAITPDSRYAYVANAVDQTVSVIALDTFPAIVTSTVPNGTAGVPYSTHLDVTGTPTPTFASAPIVGILPPGLTISPSGDLTGTPTAAGTYSFTLRVSSQVSGGIPGSDTRQYTIEVAPVVADAPLALSAQLAGDAIDLAWTAPTFDGGTPITGYRIERSINGGPFDELVADTASTATAYTDTEVQPGSTYAYRVYALNAAGESLVSNEAAVVIPPVETTTTTTTTPTTTAPSTTAPAPPVPSTQPPVPSSVPELPQTGSNSSTQTLLALVAVLGGAALLLIVRRRKPNPRRIR